MVVIPSHRLTQEFSELMNKIDGKSYPCQGCKDLTWEDIDNFDRMLDEIAKHPDVQILVPPDITLPFPVSTVAVSYVSTPNPDIVAALTRP
jgi:hypothetical protein